MGSWEEHRLERLPPPLTFYLLLLFLTLGIALGCTRAPLTSSPLLLHKHLTPLTLGTSTATSRMALGRTRVSAARKSSRSTASSSLQGAELAGCTYCGTSGSTTSATADFGHVAAAVAVAAAATAAAAAVAATAVAAAVAVAAAAAAATALLSANIAASSTNCRRRGEGGGGRGIRQAGHAKLPHFDSQRSHVLRRICVLNQVKCGRKTPFPLRHHHSPVPGPLQQSHGRKQPGQPRQRGPGDG